MIRRVAFFLTVCLLGLLSVVAAPSREAGTAGEGGNVFLHWNERVPVPVPDPVPVAEADVREADTQPQTVLEYDGYALHFVGEASIGFESVFLPFPEETASDSETLLHPLDDALRSLCHVGCGDFESQIVIRQAGEDWVVLMNQTLYAFDGGEWKPIAEWPVRVTMTAYYGKGGQSYTARDFVKRGEEWIVADTYGNRVFRMDEAFRILNEVPVPFPTEIRSWENGIAVVGLNGTSFFDRELVPVGGTPPEIMPIGSRLETEVDRQSVLIDESTGWTWAAHGGWLIRFHEAEGIWERRYIGHMYNAYLRPILIPLEGDVLVLMDERAFRFAGDGAWIAAYEYPMEFPPFDYFFAYSGELTWQMDEGRKTLYFVRGTEIVALNLANGELRDLFSRKWATIGPLLMDGKLAFTVHTGDFLLPETLANELVFLDPETGSVARQELEPGFFTYAADDGGIIVARPNPDNTHGFDLFRFVPDGPRPSD
jgi:hypothetical protein